MKIAYNGKQNYEIINSPCHTQTTKMYCIRTIRVWFLYQTITLCSDIIIFRITWMIILDFIAGACKRKHNCYKTFLIFPNTHHNKIFELFTETQFGHPNFFWCTRKQQRGSRRFMKCWYSASWVCRYAPWCSTLSDFTGKTHLNVWTQTKLYQQRAYKSYESMTIDEQSFQFGENTKLIQYNVLSRLNMA